MWSTGHLAVQSMHTDLEHRLKGVRNRIADAASRSGRFPSSITLVAVSKPSHRCRSRSRCVWPDRLRREQGAGRAGPVLAGGALPLRWHLIGHLQSNKAKKAAAVFDVIHSIDSVELLRKVSRAAAERGRQLDVLVGGAWPRSRPSTARPEAEVPAIVEAAMACQSARLTGLMLLPPAVEQARHSATVLRGRPGPARPLHCGRCAGRVAARPVDGHEPRLGVAMRKGPPSSGSARPSWATEYYA